MLLLLLLLLLMCAVPARGMTVSRISPNQFGSLGGVRLKIEGTGFPTYPMAPPKVLIGGGQGEGGAATPAVASCEVLPYLSTETVLVCEAGPASTFSDTHGERNQVDGRYTTHALRVVPGYGREATCTGLPITACRAASC